MALKDTAQIDFVALDSLTQEVVLGIVEPRSWDGSDRRIYELQEKVNAYLGFALDGEMIENLPNLEGKAIRLQLDCSEAPDARTEHFIKIIREQIGFQGITFKVRVVPELASGEVYSSGGCCGGNGGCGCAPHGADAHDDHARQTTVDAASQGKTCGSGNCGCS